MEDVSKAHNIFGIAAATALIVLFALTAAHAGEPSTNNNPVPSDPNFQIGSSPHIISVEKDGRRWADLPKPDASWANLADKKNRRTVWVLNKEEQDRILHTRLASGSMMGSFYEFNNLLFTSGHKGFLMTTSEKVSNTPLQKIFVDDYKPTYAEIFEAMARQTGTSIKYNPTFFSKWIAVAPPMPIPYSIKMANDWRSEDRGFLVSYFPKTQPVGMDIYMLGRYSGLSPAKAIDVRNANALSFAHHFDKSVTTKSMKEVKVDGCDALYYEVQSTFKNDCRWRQWSLIKNGEAFMIVSSIDAPNAKLLVPQVESMVASFHVLTPAPASPGI